MTKEEAIKHLKLIKSTVYLGNRNFLDALDRAIELLKQPERKKGHWVGIDDEPCDVYECDQCGTTYDTVDNTWDLPRFCPNCGADMRGEENE